MSDLRIEALRRGLGRSDLEDDVELQRLLVHDAFGKRWRWGPMTRSQAYAWFAQAM